MPIREVQDVIEVAIGGKPLTTTVEGRERYPVRVRYARELRDSIEAIERILVPADDGSQIPLSQLADIEYPLGVGLYFQTIGNFINTGSNQPGSLAVSDFHHADAARTVGLQLFVAAEVGNVNVGLFSCFQNSGAYRCRDLSSVNG